MAVMYPTEPLSVDDVTLDWIKVTARNAVSDEFAETVKAEVFREHVWGQLTHQLTAQVLAERLPNGKVTERKSFDFEVPASPWQQYKQDHAESWWLRWLVRWHPPVVRTHHFVGELTTDVTRYWAYPEARVARQMGQPVRVAFLNPVSNWWADS